MYKIAGNFTVISYIQEMSIGGQQNVHLYVIVSIHDLPDKQ